LGKVKKMVGRKTYYFAAGRGRGRLVKEWNLIVPDNTKASMSLG